MEKAKKRKQNDLHQGIMKTSCYPNRNIFIFQASDIFVLICSFLMKLQFRFSEREILGFPNDFSTVCKWWQYLFDSQCIQRWIPLVHFEVFSFSIGKIPASISPWVTHMSLADSDTWSSNKLEKLQLFSGLNHLELNHADSIPWKDLPLTYLKILHLNYSQTSDSLSTLPHSLIELHIEQSNVMYFPVQFAPFDLYPCSNLRRLTLRHCEWTSDFCLPCSLTYLHLIYSSISLTCDLYNLVELTSSWTWIKISKQNWCRLQRLTILFDVECRCIGISEGNILSAMSSLTYLDMRTCSDLVNLPPELPRLETFRLVFFQHEKWEKDLILHCYMPALRCLELEYCDTIQWVTTHRFPLLTELKLWETYFFKFPWKLPFPNLKTVTLHDRALLSSFDDHIKTWNMQEETLHNSWYWMIHAKE